MSQQSFWFSVDRRNRAETFLIFSQARLITGNV